MRGLDAEERISAPVGDGLGKSEPREHAEPDGDENCCGDKSETQVNPHGATLFSPAVRLPKTKVKVTFISGYEDRSISSCLELDGNLHHHQSCLEISASN